MTAKSRETIEKVNTRLEVGGVATGTSKQTPQPPQFFKPTQYGKKTATSTRKTGPLAAPAEKAVMTTAVNNLFSKIIEKSPLESAMTGGVDHHTN